MSPPHLFMAAVVLLFAMPAGVFNRTAAALVASWLIQELSWFLTGHLLPQMGGVILDYFVLAVIFTKPEVRDCSPYPTLFSQFWALLCERSWNDVVVMLIFPAMWLTHLFLDPYYGWWARWWLALAQFLVAGAEALGPLLRRRFAAIDRETYKPPPDALRSGLAGYA